MKRLSPFSLCLSVSLLLLAVGGCRNGAGTTTNTAATVNVDADPIKAVPDKDRYKVTAVTTGFFRYSPLQTSGADSDLKKGDRLTMLSHGRGFSQIKTADNQVGYVGTEDIAQLTVAEVTQEDTAILQQASAAAGGAPVPLTGPTPAASPAGRNGKKPTPAPARVSIPSDAGRNERLPEPDVRPRPTATPLVNFR